MYVFARKEDVGAIRKIVATFGGLISLISTIAVVLSTILSGAIGIVVILGMIMPSKIAVIGKLVGWGFYLIEAVLGLANVVILVALLSALAEVVNIRLPFVKRGE